MKSYKNHNNHEKSHDENSRKVVEKLNLQTSWRFKSNFSWNYGESFAKSPKIKNPKFFSCHKLRFEDQF